MKAFFINSESGNIFALYHSPPNNVALKRNILFIPPFAEELNRSRHMINRQARAFAEAGYGVLILDLYGTGDSEGTFGEATIKIWQQDILAAISWLNKSSNSPPIMWAMRSGALIITDLIQQYPDLSDQMILWSPVSNGKKFIDQYLRIKLAAEMTRASSNKKGTIKEIWASLENGQNQEIAGYDLSSELAYGFAKLSLKNIILPPKLSIKWIEISLGETTNISPASQKIIVEWEKNGNDITAISVKDVAFWNLQEPEWADEYIKQTCAFII